MNDSILEWGAMVVFLKYTGEETDYIAVGSVLKPK
jgi:hypothetical protein